MTKRNFFAAAVAALLLVLSFSSCSNSNKLLETIPSSARAVARINLMTIGNELGMKLEGDEVVVPADLEPVFGKDDKKMGAMLKEVDAENIYAFMMDNSEPLAVFALKSESGFIAAVEKISGKKAETVDGYIVIDEHLVVTVYHYLENISLIKLLLFFLRLILYLRQTSLKTGIDIHCRGHQEEY